MGAACMLGLTSCGDKEAEQGKAESKAAVQEKVEAPEKSTPVVVENAQQEELLNYMIFNVGKRIGDHAADMEWREDVRDMRNKLESYYESLNAQNGNVQTRIQLGLMLADITRSMGSIDKAQTYYADLLKLWESQDQETRASLEGRRERSSIANGMGACNLMQRKTAEALPYYEEALKIDTDIFNELAPDDGGALPAGDDLSPDLARAAEDILSSYRCLGDCQRWADDPEEARDTYKKGIELVNRMSNLNAGISLQYIRLLSAQGDLENSCGEIKKAGMAWAQACKLAEGAYKIAPNGSLRAKIRRDYRKLENSIKAIRPKLQEQQETARKAADAEGAIPADDSAEGNDEQL